MVQLNALEYDSDIDGQTDILLDIQPQVNQFRILQNTHYIRMLNNPGNNTKIAQGSQLEDIPELEDEDWEDGQFTDARMQT